MTTISANNPAVKPVKRRHREINAINPVANLILHIIFILAALACIVPFGTFVNDGYVKRLERGPVAAE